MIQRIQSVYLLLSALILALGSILTPKFIVDGTPIAASDNYIHIGLIGLVAGINLATIFLYKNRQQQVVLNRLSIIILFVVFGLYVWDFVDYNQESAVQFGLGAIVPFIGVILLVLANRGIMKDETLVRAADRFR